MTSLTSQEVAAKRLILRVAAPEFEELQQLVFRRYPNWELKLPHFCGQFTAFESSHI